MRVKVQDNTFVSPKFMFPIKSIKSPKLIGSRFCLAYTLGQKRPK